MNILHTNTLSDLAKKQNLLLVERKLTADLCFVFSLIWWLPITFLGSGRHFQVQNQKQSTINHLLFPHSIPPVSRRQKDNLIFRWSEGRGKIWMRIVGTLYDAAGVVFANFDFCFCFLSFFFLWNFLIDMQMSITNCEKLSRWLILSF